MKYTQKREKNTLKITFKASLDEWNKFDQRAYEQSKGKYSLPGFRKGHVPKHILESHYGRGLFLEDALYMCAQEYYSEFLDKNKDVMPVARPSIDEKSFKLDDKGLTFAVVVAVRPLFTLGQYKGLTVQHTQPQEVSDEDVDTELKQLQQKSARYLEVTDRPVQQGDQLKIDYCGKVDGVAFEGGTAKDQTLTIGSHAFIEGFEEQLVGFNPGETRDIQVTFPADYHAENLQGKQAVFTVTVNSITKCELPDIDDEFACDVSDFNTLDELKADIRRSKAEQYAKDAQREDENKILDLVVSNTEIDIPPEMIDEQVSQYIEDFEYQLRGSGLTLENFLSYSKQTEQQLRDEYRPRAEKAVHSRLVFEEIVKQEGITADPAKVEEKIRKYAQDIGVEYDEFKGQLQQGDMYYFENQAVTEALIELLKRENKVD